MEVYVGLSRLPTVMKKIISCVCLQVELSFLMVGHTHEAVDRYFSFINKCLTEYGDSITGKEMLERIRNYLKTGEVLETEELEYVADWTKWMKGCDDIIHDHTGKGSALHWKFERDVPGGPVLLRQKHLVSDQLWIPKDGLAVIKSVPAGIPDAAEYKPLGGSESTMYLKRLRRTVVLLEEAGLFANDDQRKWWNDLVESEATQLIPVRYTNESEFRMSFPIRGANECLESIRNAEEARSAPVEISEADRFRFGAVQRKESYLGKLQTRKKRNDHAANLEQVSKDSFVMLQGEDKNEPLLFGIVLEVNVEAKTFKMQYCGREDNSDMDLSQSFKLLYTAGRTTGNTKRKKTSAVPWIQEFHFDVILLFDISHSKRRNVRSTFQITQSGLERCNDAIKNLDSLGNDDHQSEDNNEDHDSEDDNESEEDFRCGRGDSDA